MCHSGKDTLGCSGKPCKKYRSNTSKTPAGLARTLFPEEVNMDMGRVRAGVASATVRGKKVKISTKAAKNIDMWNSFATAS